MNEASLDDIIVIVFWRMIATIKLYWLPALAVFNLLLVGFLIYTLLQLSNEFEMVLELVVTPLVDLICLDTIVVTICTNLYKSRMFFLIVTIMAILYTVCFYVPQWSIVHYTSLIWDVWFHSISIISGVALSMYIKKQTLSEFFRTIANVLMYALCGKYCISLLLAVWTLWSVTMRI